MDLRAHLLRRVVSFIIQDHFFRFVVFSDPAYNPLTFDFDTDISQVAATAEIFDATSPDLSTFKAAGGKLLMWHGVADPALTSDRTIQYYNDVTKAMGNKNKSRSEEFGRVLDRRRNTRSARVTPVQGPRDVHLGRSIGQLRPRIRGRVTGSGRRSARGRPRAKFVTLIPVGHPLGEGSITVISTGAVDKDGDTPTANFTTVIDTTNLQTTVTGTAALTRIKFGP